MIYCKHNSASFQTEVLHCSELAVLSSDVISKAKAPWAPEYPVQTRLSVLKSWAHKQNALEADSRGWDPVLEDRVNVLSSFQTDWLERRPTQRQWALRARVLSSAECLLLAGAPDRAPSYSAAELLGALTLPWHELYTLHCFPPPESPFQSRVLRDYSWHQRSDATHLWSAASDLPESHEIFVCSVACLLSLSSQAQQL